MRRIFWLSLLFFVFLNCSRTANQSIKLGGELVIDEGNPLPGLDPAVVDHIENQMIAFQLFDGLLQYQPIDFKLIPALAETWHTPDSGRIWTFRLRCGVRFNDDACFADGIGREVIADDFKYSLERIINWRENDSGWKIFQEIEGANEFRRGKATEVRGIIIIDRYTLQIRLTKPSFLFLHRLANQKGWVVPQEAIVAYGSKFREHPVGTGPFRLISWDPVRGVYLVKNPKYWERDSTGIPLPYLTAICFPLGPFYSFNGKTLPQFEGKDFATISAENEEYLELIRAYNETQNERLKLRICSTPIANSFFYVFRMDADSPWAKNKLLRQALAWAIDREVFVGKGSLQVILAKGLIPPKLTGYRSLAKCYEFNLDKARELLSRAGFPNGHCLPSLQLHVLGHSIGSDCQKVARDLTAIGIRLEFMANPAAVHFDAVARGEYDFFRDGWIADYPDPFDFFQLFNSLSPYNHAHYHNIEYDALFDRAQREQNQEKQFRLFQRMETILSEDCPAIFIMHELDSYAIHPKVHNLNLCINPCRLKFYKYVWIEP